MADLNVQLNVNVDKLGELLGKKIDGENLGEVIQDIFGDGISNVSVGQDANASPNMGFGDDFISSDCLGQTQTDIYSVPESYTEDPNAIDYDEIADSLKHYDEIDRDAMMSVLYSGKYSSEDIVNIMKAYQDQNGRSIEQDLTGRGDTAKAIAEGFKNAREDYAKNNLDNKLSDEQVQEKAKSLFSYYEEDSFMNGTTIAGGIKEENLQKFLYDESISSGDKYRILTAYKEMNSGDDSLKAEIKDKFYGETKDLYLDKLDEIEKELGY